MAGLSGKYIATLANASQETTLALANLNFDFSLFKVEAPKEYDDVGQFLSKKRRDAAENGSEHITARKLGALFAQALPETPKLIRAYGVRCSEIARCSAASPSTSRTKNLFQDWAGADATSIWAAATSGTGAIAVHLLACMLARVWSAPEATAIWAEVIESRKIELAARDPSDPLNLSSLAVSRVDIKKDEILRWDASARAWLSVADDVQKRKQKQLMLLLDDLNLPISARDGTYGSVMAAWKGAMHVMESILTDTSQSIVNGGVLAGLASWHLYPNVWACDANPNMVEFGDNLIPPKVLVTLGVGKTLAGDGSSIHWSLPLAYMRFYGDPIPASSSITATSTRLTMPECLFVVLGVFFSGWKDDASDIDQACRLVVAMSDHIFAKSFQIKKDTSWLQHLSHAAQDFFTSYGPEREQIENLIYRGQRRYATFLAPEVAHPDAMFGLGNARLFIKLIKDPEHKVAALRLIAQKLMVNTGTLLIRYRRSNVSTTAIEFPFDDYLVNSFEPGDENANSLKQQREEHQWGFATALDSLTQSRKRKHDSSVELSGHARWGANLPSSRNGELFNSFGNVIVQKCGADRFFWGHKRCNQDHPPADCVRLFVSILGDPEDAAIFGIPGQKSSNISEDPLVPEIIVHALEQSWIDLSLLIHQLDYLEDEYLQFFETLQAVAVAANVYKLMPGATVNSLVFTQPFRESKWIPSKAETVHGRGDGQTLESYRLTRGQTMACIARFENVKVDLDPDSLESVMALSIGNSIYVSAPLICDPFDRPLEHEVRYIMGNIGKPGLSFMIPPMSPKIRKPDETAWTPINHRPFNGSFDDCYQHTSLHLNFTGYVLPVSTRYHGEHVSEAFFVESVVSIFDHSHWVADLDILGALSKPCLRRIDESSTCQHSESGIPAFPLVSIDSWDEYLDRPLKPAIFRCNNNWLARLAIVSLHALHSRQTILFPLEEAVCWQCVSQVLHSMKDISLTSRKDSEKLPLFVR